MCEATNMLIWCCEWAIHHFWCLIWRGGWGWTSWPLFSWVYSIFNLPCLFTLMLLFCHVKRAPLFCVQCWKYMKNMNEMKKSDKHIIKRIDIKNNMFFNRNPGLYCIFNNQRINIWNNKSPNSRTKSLWKTFHNILYWTFIYFQVARFLLQQLKATRIHNMNASTLKSYFSFNFLSIDTYHQYMKP